MKIENYYYLNSRRTPAAVPDLGRWVSLRKAPLKQLLLFFLFALSAFAVSCSKPQADPAEDAFSQKFQALRL